jgi:hypothetical protein
MCTVRPKKPNVYKVAATPICSLLWELLYCPAMLNTTNNQSISRMQANNSNYTEIDNMSAGRHYRWDDPTFERLFKERADLLKAVHVEPDEQKQMELWRTFLDVKDDTSFYIRLPSFCHWVRLTRHSAGYGNGLIDHASTGLQHHHGYWQLHKQWCHHPR